MIDHTDADDFFLVSLFTSGPWGLVFILVAVVLMFVAMSNESDCSKLACPNNSTPKLTEHECLCVVRAK